MFTISCYDIHPVAARYKKIWYFAQHASDCLLFLMAISCCKCLDLNSGDPTTLEDDDSVSSYQITRKRDPIVNVAKPKKDAKQQVEAQIYDANGCGDTGGDNRVVEIPSNSDIEIHSEVNASGQQLVFEYSDTSIESEIGGIKNDCYQDSDPEDMEIIDMENLPVTTTAYSSKSSTYKITKEHYEEDIVSKCPSTKFIKSSRMEIKQSVLIDKSRSDLQSACRFPSVHSCRKTDNCKFSEVIQSRSGGKICAMDEIASPKHRY